MRGRLTRMLPATLVAVAFHSHGLHREAVALPIARPATPPRAEAAAVDPAAVDAERKDAVVTEAKPGAGTPRLRAREMKPAAGRDAAAADMPAGRDGYLGVFTGGVSDELRAQLDLPEDCGLVVRRVAAGSPAEKAGLEANDILLEFGGREVTSPLDFAEMVQATKGGARVRLGIVRRGKRRTVDAVIGERDAVAGVDGRPEMQPGNLGGLPPQLQAQLLQQQIIQGQLNAAIAQGLAQAQAQVGGGP